MGAQPIIGYNYGARKFGRMKRTLGQGILLGIAITTPLWLTVLFLPDMYAHLFSLDVYKRQVLLKLAGAPMSLSSTVWQMSSASCVDFR